MELIFNPESSFLTYFSETDRGFFLGRQQSTVIHPQTWLSIVSLFLFYILLLVFQYKKWNKILLIGLLGGLMFNLITGGSRSGLIAGLIGLTFVFFHTNVKSQIKIGTSLISLIFICTCILPLTFHDSILDYVKSIIFIANDKYSIEGSSLSLREEQLNGCWSLIKENPLTGNGFGWVTDYLNIHKEHPVLWGFESLLFFALVDTGIIGLFNWCLLFYGLFKVNIVILKKYNITNRYMKGILNGHLIAIVVFLFVCGNFFSLWFFFISYVILLKFICIEYGRFNNYC
jgi:hypothetical protein